MLLPSKWAKKGIEAIDQQVQKLSAGALVNLKTTNCGVYFSIAAPSHFFERWLNGNNNARNTNELNLIALVCEDDNLSRVIMTATIVAVIIPINCLTEGFNVSNNNDRWLRCNYTLQQKDLSVV